MAAFFGVSQVSATNTVELCIWPGIKTFDNSAVLQPMLQRNRSSDPQAWSIRNAINHRGSQIEGGPDGAIHMPQGVWGVIRHVPPYWLVGCYRGNARNTGPAFGGPVPGQSILNVLIKNDPRWGIFPYDMTRVTFVESVVDIEIPDSDGGSGWSCSDINIQAVWGGITVHEGPNPLPVTWFPGTNVPAQPGNNIACSFVQSVQ